MSFLSLGATVSLACVMTACSPAGEGVTAQGAGPGRGGRGAGQGPVPITTASVVTQSVPVDVQVIGAAEASQTVAVRAQITGQLTAVNFKEGDDVTEGQVLFTLDRRPLEAILRQAEASLERDSAQAANARSSSARYQDLLSRGIATREQADQSRTSAQALEATVEADRAAVENAKVQLAYATISAPISGRTGALMVHAGNLVRANDTTPLVTINAISPINVAFGLPEQQLPELKRRLAQGTVRVEAGPPNEPTRSEGRITFTDNAVDQTTGQIKIKGSFTNADRRLWPGEFLNVVLTLRTDADAIVVPTAAVQNGQQGTYAYVVKPDNTVALRNITVERQTTQTSVVKEGLKPGEIVVTDGHLRLVAGSRVSIKSGPGAKSAGEKVTP